MRRPTRSSGSQDRSVEAHALEDQVIDFDISAIQTEAEENSAITKDQHVQDGAEEAENLTRRNHIVEARIKARGLSEFFELRKGWSHWIIGWITALIAFNVAITMAVGLSYLDFSEYQWFITAVTVETFLQIVGMGYIAVRFLFGNNT